MRSNANNTISTRPARRSRQSAFAKDVRRSIAHSMGRFIALFAIMALGVGFYAGLRMTCPDMNLAADEYFDNTSLMDVRVVSTMGMNDENVEALRQVEGVDQVMPAYETDAIAYLDDKQYTVRVHSLPSAALSQGENAEAVGTASGKESSEKVASEGDNASGEGSASGTASSGATSDADSEAVPSDSTSTSTTSTSDTNSTQNAYLNQLVLKEGRWPQNPGECVVSADRVMSTPTQLGDIVKITKCNSNLSDTLATDTFTIVGYVHSSYYPCSTSMGSSSLGSGVIQQFMYIPETDFSSSYPITECFLTVSGAKELRGNSSAYKDKIAEVIERINAIAPAQEQIRLDDIKAEAQKELDEKKVSFETEKASAESQLADAKVQLDVAALTLSQSEQELAQGWQEYYSGLTEFSHKKENATQQLAQAEEELKRNQELLDRTKEELDAAAIQLSLAWQAAGISPAQAPFVIAQLQEQLSHLTPGTPEYITLATQIAQLQMLLDQQIAYDQGMIQWQEGTNQLKQAQRDLEQAKLETQTQLASAEKTLQAAYTTLSSGESSLSQGYSEYKDGLSQYATNAQDATKQFASAALQIEEAQHTIDAIDRPEWLVLDRTKIYGVVSYYADADRIDAIASVFPFIFFLVAALVVLTTMTRMVDEERILIGTYKALGYKKLKIVSKYLIYAAIASVLGSLVGILIFSQVLPMVVMVAYAIIYYVPYSTLPVDIPLAAQATGLGLVITLSVTIAAVLSTLREKPAQLMLPRLSKAGKEILLERIRPLWRHFSFTQKVTWRNLFLYKKRFIMTVIGIAGCTALLLTGFGLRDSINDIIDLQFGEIIHYNTDISLENDASEQSLATLTAILSNSPDVSEFTQVHLENMMVNTPSSKDWNVNMVVPQEVSGLSKLISFRERESGSALTFDENSVIINEKLATTLGIKVGDTLNLFAQDNMGNASGASYQLCVTGITENYVLNYVYMGPRIYQQTFGKTPFYESVLANCLLSVENRADFEASLQALPDIKTISFNDEVISAYKSMLKSVNLVVVVLVVAAAALSFIVLYNLTNINIGERQREIATLKVLGFTAKEVKAYIFREVVILTLIGALVGLFLGIFMESFVVVTAEVDQVMFGRIIHTPSFFISFIITMVFSWIVMFAMRKRLHSVNMVESLKSVE